MTAAVAASTGVTDRDAHLRRIVQMTAAFAASDVLRGAVRLMTSLVIARGLGRDTFGAWTLWGAWASAITVVLDLGFGVLLTREAARDRGLRSLVTGALTARLTFFLPVSLLILSFPGMLGATRQIAVPLAALAGAGIIYGTVAAVFRTRPARLMTVLVIEGIGAFAQCAGAVLIAIRHGRVEDLLWLATAVLTGQVAAATVLLLRSDPIRSDRPGFAAAWVLLRRALPFAANGVIANAQARVGPLMLGVLGGPADLAAYGAAMRLENAARRLPYAAFGAAFPVFSSVAGRAASVRLRFNAILRAFAVVAGLCLAAAAAPLVRMTYGSAFSGAVVPLMWAGAVLVPSLVNAGRKVYLNATGAENVTVRWSGAALAIQIAAAAVMIPRFGAAGAVVAIGVGELAILIPLRAAERDPNRDLPESVGRVRAATLPA